MQQRVIKFRVWNGETMISPDYITRDGLAHWQENNIPETSSDLMMSIGLLDRNGTEIFESDFLFDRPRNRKYKVIRVAGGFAINTFQDEFENPKFTEALADMQTQGYVTGCCHVIGNVHQPNL